MIFNPTMQIKGSDEKEYLAVKLEGTFIDGDPECEFLLKKAFSGEMVRGKRRVEVSLGENFELTGDSTYQHFKEKIRELFKREISFPVYMECDKHRKTSAVHIDEKVAA